MMVLKATSDIQLKLYPEEELEAAVELVKFIAGVFGDNQQPVLKGLFCNWFAKVFGRLGSVSR